MFKTLLFINYGRYLHTAARKCDVDLVNVLLDHGASPELRDDQGNLAALPQINYGFLGFKSKL